MFTRNTWTLLTVLMCLIPLLWSIIQTANTVDINTTDTTGYYVLLVMNVLATVTLFIFLIMSILKSYKIQHGNLSKDETFDVGWKIGVVFILLILANILSSPLWLTSQNTPELVAYCTLAGIAIGMTSTLVDEYASIPVKCKPKIETSNSISKPTST